MCSARLQSKMAGDNDKSVVLGVLLSLLALITAFQHQFSIIYNWIFQTQQQRAMIFHLNHTTKMVGGKTRPPEAVYMEVESS